MLFQIFHAFYGCELNYMILRRTNQKNSELFKLKLIQGVSLLHFEFRNILSFLFLLYFLSLFFDDKVFLSLFSNSYNSF